MSTNMWPLGPIASKLLDDATKKPPIMVDAETILGVERMAEIRAEREAAAQPHHEFDRPKNEAAVLQAAGEFMLKMIAPLNSPLLLKRAYELSASLVRLSQQPLRFPARELHSEPVVTLVGVDTCPGIDACSDVTKELIAELIRRDEHGRKKYGVNLNRSDLTLEQWLQHQKEELLDGAGYAQAALAKLRAPTKE